MNRKIACLDADIIIKSNHKLMDKIVEVFDDIFLHIAVYNEVKWPEEIRKKLKKLIARSKLKLISDEYLYEQVEYKRLFLDALCRSCDIFAVDYDEKYFELDKSDDNNKNEFLNLLGTLDNNISNNLGEIKTLQMIILLRDQIEEEVEYFISDDRRARNAIILGFGSIEGLSVHGISMISLFYFFKEAGMQKKEAISYVKSLNFSETKVYDKNSDMIKLNNIGIINRLYSEELKLLKTGDFKVRR